MILCSIFASAAGAADQKGTESTKQPASVEIMPAKAKKTSAQPADTATAIGNVQMTYADGTKDLWTTKGNCSMPEVATDWTVGWTVHGDEVKINSADKMRPNGTLVVFRKGNVLAMIKSAKSFIEKSDFHGTEGQLVLLTRGSHGPANIKLHDVATGKLIESVKESAENPPEWPKPYQDK